MYHTNDIHNTTLGKSIELMNYSNTKWENSAKSTTEVAKGIENRVGNHSDCASPVVVLGGVPFASEYEGQVSP